MIRRSVGALLAWGRGVLEPAGVDRPQVEARLLLGCTTGLDIAAMLGQKDAEVDLVKAEEYRRMVEERAMTRAPLQYLVGSVEFRSLELVVTRGVFIPRPETELVVDEALQCLSGMDTPKVADVGAGTGAIGIAIAHQRVDAQVWAIDIDPIARKCVSVNAARLGVGGRIRVTSGDMLSRPVGGEPFDLIVSNPPYIRTSDIVKLAPEVSVHEPKLALDGGDDGLAAYRSLLSDAWRRCRPGGYVVLELGMGQSHDVQQIQARVGRYRCESIRDDYAGHQRIMTLRVMEEGEDGPHGTGHGRSTTTGS